MASYKQRVTVDLDGWIAAGHVARDRREAILASIPDGRRLDAATALAWVGAVLAGVAVIAFVAANWDGLPRLARFALVLSVFGAAAAGAAWCASNERLRASNGLLTFAALVFAAAIGLTGQIFDLTGDTRVALYTAGAVAGALALAGGASGPAVAALGFIGAADFLSPWRGPEMAWLLIAAPVGCLLAVRWRSAPLAHVGALGLTVACQWLLFAKLADSAVAALAFSLVLAALAAGGRVLRERGLAFGGVFEGWFAWGALGFFVAAGVPLSGHDFGVGHRLAWLALAGGLVALGRHDRHPMVTTIGVLGLLGAIGALLIDFGMTLMTAAGVFLVAAILAGGAGLALRRRPAR